MYIAIEAKYCDRLPCYHISPLEVKLMFCYVQGKRMRRDLT